MPKSSNFSEGNDKDIQCPFCYGFLQNPKILDCSHAACQTCLEKWFRELSSRGRLGDITCPECRRTTRIPKGPNGGVCGLPTSRNLINVVEAARAEKAAEEIQEILPTGKSKVELLEKPLWILREIHKNANELVQYIRKQEAILCGEVGEFYHMNYETIKEDKCDLDELHSSASKSVHEAETILQQTMPERTRVINAAENLKEQIAKIDELKMNQETSIHEYLQFEINSNAKKNCKSFGKLTKEKLKKGLFRLPSRFQVPSSSSQSQSTNREPSQQQEFQEILPPISEIPITRQRISNKARGLQGERPTPTNAVTRLPPISGKRTPKQRAPLLPCLQQEGLPPITPQKGARTRPVVESTQPLTQHAQRRRNLRVTYGLLNINKQSPYGNESPLSSD